MLKRSNRETFKRLMPVLVFKPKTLAKYFFTPIPCGFFIQSAFSHTNYNLRSHRIIVATIKLDTLKIFSQQKGRLRTLGPNVLKRP